MNKGGAKTKKIPTQKELQRLNDAADAARERVSKMSRADREELLRGAFETIRKARR